jgi:hypothetical protein
MGAYSNNRNNGNKRNQSTAMNLRDLEMYILLNVNLECQGAKNTCGNCVLCGLDCSCLILFNNALLNCCDYLARNKVIKGVLKI